MYGDDAIEWWCWSAHYPVGKLQDVEVVGGIKEDIRLTILLSLWQFLFFSLSAISGY